MSMPAVTVVLGVILVVLGVIGGQKAGTVHAYIPAMFGAVFLVLGGVAHNENARRHAMHVAAVIALLGFFGTADGLVAIVRWGLGGTPPAIPMMAMAKSVMCLLCLGYEALCVKSFIDARRAR